MLRDPLTGRLDAGTDLGLLQEGDQISVTISDCRQPTTWNVTVLTVEALRPQPRQQAWITGLHRGANWCRILVRVG